jgi:flagellar basal body-associated protein FliL
VLAGLAVSSAFLGGVTIAFRDTNVEGAELVALSAADAEGRHLVPGTGVPGSMWPLVAAFGAALLVLGIVVDWRFLVLGVLCCLAALVEWMVQSWADRASSDQAYNAKLRGRVMHPIEFPALGVLVVGFVIFGFSRLMLALPKVGSTWTFIGVGVVILAVAVVFATKPTLSKNVLSAVLVVGAVAVLTAGIISIGVGERSFAHSESEQETTNEVGDKASVAATVFSSGGALTPSFLSIPRSLTVTIIFENQNAEGTQRLVVEGAEVTTTSEEGAEVTEPQRFVSADVGEGQRGTVIFKIGKPGEYKYFTEGDGPEATGTIVVP